MSQIDQQTLDKTFAKNLGQSYDNFKSTSHNSKNAQTLLSLQNNEWDGIESKVFSLCYQKVRNQAGPYKIFGSKQVQDVSACINRYVDAWNKTKTALNI